MSEITIQNTDSYFELGCKLNLLTNDVNQMAFSVAEKLDLDPKSIKSVQENALDLKEKAEILKQEVEISETIIARFLRKLLSLIGITTTYQEILTEIQRFEKEAEDCIELTEVIIQREKYEKVITKKTNELNEEFGSFEEELNALKVRVANLFEDGAEFRSCHEVLSDLQLKFNACACDISMLLKNYRGDIPALAEIKKFGDRVQAFKDTLKDVRAQLNGVLTGASAVRTESIKIGGIQNAGNTCYMASALQVLNAVPLYRDLFDPKKNPLSKRKDESDTSLKQRKAIQASCFTLLNKVSAGITVLGEEVEAFCKTCYAHEIGLGKRVIEKTHDQQDGEEALYNLLDVMDYKHLPLTFKYQYLVKSENDYNSVDLAGANPKGYSTIEEAARGTKRPGELNFSVINYTKSSVPMRTLVKEFWKKEVLKKHTFVHHDSETGNSSFREYQNVTKIITLHEESVIPEVLRVIIPQYTSEKATIVAPDVIYPFNKMTTQLTERADGGPKYSLAAAIEHRPGHYVAHVRKDRSFILMNDSSVTEDPSSDFPGRLYIYTLVNEERSD